MDHAGACEKHALRRNAPSNYVPTHRDAIFWNSTPQFATARVNSNGIDVTFVTFFIEERLGLKLDKRSKAASCWDQVPGLRT